MACPPSDGFGYLFERFPSFTQTFCVREVLEMRRQGVPAPLWSIRNPSDEHHQSFPDCVRQTTHYLPESFSEILESDPEFRRAARKSMGDLRDLWGDESEKRRVYEALWLLPELRREGITHVHAHFAGTAARTSFWINRLGGIHYSFTAHANDIFCDEPHSRLDMLIKHSSGVITVSNFSVDFLQAQFPAHASKIVRVYNGIHLDRFRTSTPNPQKPLILAVGRYIEKKGFAHLIAACRNLPSDLPFECLVVGQGPLEESLRASAAGDPRIQVTGPKCENEIVDLLARASIFALPCVDEAGGGKDNLPTVIMEAMAAALPVISTPVAGVPEMVKEGETGHLVPVGDITALTQRLSELLQQPAKAHEMGLRGQQLCRENFATERTTESLRNVLQGFGAFNGPPATGWMNRLFGR